jgi:hypothetical protein
MTQRHVPGDRQVFDLSDEPAFPFEFGDETPFDPWSLEPKRPLTLSQKGARMAEETDQPDFEIFDHF